MKKVLLFLTAIIISTSVFSQENLNFFSISGEYQTKSPSADWGEEWIEATNPVLIYIDFGFGFIAIENGYHDRFVMKDLKKLDEEQFRMKCVDKEGKNCTVDLLFFSTGNRALVIMYNDVHYTYLIRKNSTAEGYPNFHFNKDKGNKITTPGKNI